MNPLSDIHIHVTRQQTNNSFPFGEKIELKVNLADKIKEYVQEVGYSNANLMTIFMQLLTKGKVRVDFENYTERLELARHGAQEVIPFEALGGMVNQFIQDLKDTAKSKNLSASKSTQSIIIQTRFIKDKTSVIKTKSHLPWLRQ